MTDLEKVEDMYPWLKFWMIDVPNKHYHGHIEGNDVYLNENQSNEDWLKTALHECVHSEFDYGDLSSKKKYRTLQSEKWAVCESKRMFRALFEQKNAITSY